MVATVGPVRAPTEEERRVTLVSSGVALSRARRDAGSGFGEGPNCAVSVSASSSTEDRCSGEGRIVEGAVG